MGFIERAISTVYMVKSIEVSIAVFFSLSVVILLLRYVLPVLLATLQGVKYREHWHTVFA